MPAAIIAMSSKNVFPDSPIIFRSNQRGRFFALSIPFGRLSHRLLQASCRLTHSAIASFARLSVTYHKTDARKYGICLLDPKQARAAIGISLGKFRKIPLVTTQSVSRRSARL